MTDPDHLLSEHLRDVLIQSDDIPRTDFIENNEKDGVQMVEGALLTLWVEAKRRQWDENQLAKYLGTLQLATGSSDDVINAYKADKTIHQVLKRTRARKLKLVGFRCQVEYEIYNSFQGRVSRPQCLLQLNFMGSGPEKLILACTTSEMQDLLSQFRDICHNIKAV